MPDRVISQVERVLALKAFESFKDLSPQELAVLAENARPRWLRAGELLFRRGMPIRSIHFILHGSVEIRSDHGAPVRLHAQDVVGGMAALIGDDHAWEARALEPTTTLQLDRDDLEDVFEEHFSALLGVLRILSRAQIAARRKLGASAGFSASESGAPMRSVSAQFDIVDKLLLLRRALDFAHSRVEALADLAQEARVVHAGADEVLWKIGDLADDNLLVVEGVIAGKTASEQQSFEFGPGTFVGSIDSLAGEPRWYEASAKTALIALAIRAQHLLDVLEDNSDLGMDMLRVFAATLRNLQTRISEPLDQPIR